MPVRVSSRRSRVPIPGAAARLSPTAFGLPAPPVGYAQKPAGISLCMIVKDEERFLDQCLRSVKGHVDEICVVDTGSTDRTIEIARAHGARIAERPWRNDFGWARNQSLAMATKRWILQLDADEELLAQSHAAMALLRNAPAYRTGVWVRCHNAADDYGGTGSMSHAIVRVFPNAEEIRYRGMVHEFVTIDDSPTGIKAVPSPLAIVHHGYLRDIVAARNKGARNMEIIRAAVEREPNDPFHWFNLGMTAYLMGDNEQARDGFEKMFELNGREPRGFIPNGLATLADVYTERLHQPEKAERTARLCLELSKHYANAHFSLGKALAAQGRRDEARAAYSAAIEDGKHKHEQFVVDDEVSVWKAHSEIGASYGVEKNDEEALKWFDRGLANRPTVEPLRLNRARCLERLGRIREAEEAFRALYDDFGNEQCALQYVNFLLRQDRGRAAVETIESAIGKVKPETAVTMLVAATAVAQRGGWAGAERYLERALELQPGAHEALDPLEAIYRARGDEVGVARLLRNEAAVAPRNAGDATRRSHRGIANRRFDEGLAAALDGLAHASSDAKLHYNAAICLVNLSRADEALVHLDALGAGSGEPFERGLYLKAVILRERGRRAEALDTLQRLLERQAKHDDALRLRASTAAELASEHLAAGRLDEARRVAEQALA